MPGEHSSIEVMALGRPFSLGMLYDHRSDRFIPGMTLWEPSILPNHISMRSQPFTNYLIKIENSLIEKADLLSSESVQKLGLLSGLVDVSGSAQYVKDHKTRTHQARVILKYSSTVHYSELLITDLVASKMVDTDVLNRTSATHVVAGIVYGADAYFVFDLKLAEHQEKSEIENAVEALLYKLPKFSMGEDVTANMDSEEKSLAKSLTCTFYGDFNLEQNPSTFEQVVKIYGELPSLLAKNGENAVAKTVYLYSLRSLNQSTVPSLRDLNTDLVNRCLSLMNHFYQLERDGNDLVHGDQPGTDLNKELVKTFVDHIRRFHAKMKQKIVELLPKIRGHDVGESELTDFLQQVEASPFNHEKLSSWLDTKKRETLMRSNYIRTLITNPKVDCSSNAINIALSDLNTTHAFCLSICLTDQNDAYVDMLSSYLHGKTANEADIKITKSWTTDPKILVRFKQTSNAFLSLIQANSDNEKIKFIIFDKNIGPENDRKGVFITLYEHYEEKDFELSDKLEVPTVISVEHNRIQLSWTQSSDETTNVEQYKMICTQIDGENPQRILMIPKNSNTIVFEQLIANTKYVFKLQAILTGGIAIQSDWTDPIVTKFPTDVNHEEPATPVTTKGTTTTLLSFLTKKSSEIEDSTDQQISSNLNNAAATSESSVPNKTPRLIPISSSAKWAKSGTTIAGSGKQGNGIDQLCKPHGLFLDDRDGSLMIADYGNHRIVAWKEDENMNKGCLIAGGNGKGDRLDQLNGPTDVLIDRENDSLIICDSGNRRVIRWSLGSGNTEGQIIIDNIDCFGLTMDDVGNLYVTDIGKHEVRRYERNEKTGEIVAGGNGRGDSLKQLNKPVCVFVDGDGAVYVSDQNNHRVMKWVKGATEGIIIAGGRGAGADVTELSFPRGIFVDTKGALYVVEGENHRVTRWRKGMEKGEIIVGKNGSGPGSNQLHRPTALFFVRDGSLYISDCDNHRVQRFDIEKSTLGNFRSFRALKKN